MKTDMKKAMVSELEEKVIRRRSQDASDRYVKLVISVQILVLWNASSCNFPESVGCKAKMVVTIPVDLGTPECISSWVSTFKGQCADLDLLKLPMKFSHTKCGDF